MMDVSYDWLRGKKAQVPFQIICSSECNGPKMADCLVQSWECIQTDRQTDGQTHGHSQVHYLAASQSIKIAMELVPATHTIFKFGDAMIVIGLHFSEELTSGNFFCDWFQEILRCHIDLSFILNRGKTQEPQFSLSLHDSSLFSLFWLLKKNQTKFLINGITVENVLFDMWS